MTQSIRDKKRPVLWEFVIALSIEALLLVILLVVVSGGFEGFAHQTLSNDKSVSQPTVGKTRDVVELPPPPVPVISDQEKDEPVEAAVDKTPQDVTGLPAKPIESSGGQVVINVDPSPSPQMVTPPQARSNGHEIGLSVADDLTGLSQEELDQWLDDMVLLGVTWVRLDFDWSWIQRFPDRDINWTKIDRVVAAANARNLKLLPILVYTPVWARQDRCKDSNRCPPADPDDFANFATQAVERYAPQGIHHWEIWNEPNMRGSWLPEANAGEYRDLLAAAYRAIKRIDPSAMVITGGLGPIETRNGNIEMLEYLRYFYAVDARPYFDAIALHPYSFPVLPTHDQDWNAWQQAADTQVSVRSIMNEYGDGAKQIWVTEYGAPTGGPGGVADEDHDYTTDKATHVTEKFQAEILEDAITDIEKRSWAGPMFWYSYKDYGTSPNTIENFFGIRRSDGSTKPAYWTLKEFLN